MSIVNGQQSTDFSDSNYRFIKSACYFFTKSAPFCIFFINLLKIIGCKEYSISQLMEKVGLKHRPNFIEYHLNPAISEGYIRLLYPDKPRHPRQKYLLTIKGLTLYNELIKNNNN